MFPIKMPLQITKFVYSLTSISCWALRRPEEIFQSLLSASKQCVKFQPCRLAVLLEVNVGLLELNTKSGGCAGITWRSEL